MVPVIPNFIRMTTPNPVVFIGFAFAASTIAWFFYDIPFLLGLGLTLPVCFMAYVKMGALLVSIMTYPIVALIQALIDALKRIVRSIRL